MPQEVLADRISTLPGPILITGAGGFIGSHLYSTLLKSREDVYGMCSSADQWRLKALGITEMVQVDLTNFQNLKNILHRLEPKTIFNLAAYGGYSYQQIVNKTYKTNLEVVDSLALWCVGNSALLIQAGSSSEYGTNCSAPLESDIARPNSRYAVSKLAATNFLEFISESRGLCAAVARLYSVYGPLEDPNRLIPTLIRRGLEGELPEFSPREITRDFLYVDDAVEGLIAIASYLIVNQKFEIFNLSSGVATKMIDVAEVAKSYFSIKTSAVFVDDLRSWDLKNWFGNSDKANKLSNWNSSTNFSDGFTRTALWYLQNDNRQLLNQDLSNSGRDVSLLDSDDLDSTKNSDNRLSIIIACYRDELAITEMHKRLTTVLSKTGIDYEVIFVNDCSPDNTAEVIRLISGTDQHVIGINHSRNFGSQAAFLSGMTMATGDACILMDGDLQDPPEVIASFIEKWREGYEVVYGVRIVREASILMQFAYKAFYRLLSSVSSFHVPRDAGDFSLISRPVMNAMLAFGERDVFLRTSRAYVGHRQCGVDYVRPKRPYGASTNNIFKNIGWAIKGVISVSKRPLTYMSISGLVLSVLAFFGLVLQLLLKLFFPSGAPPGAVTTILISIFFGSINLLGISVVGEYVGRILEEVRGRPRFISRSLTRNGKEELSQRIDGSS